MPPFAAASHSAQNAGQPQANQVVESPYILGKTRLVKTSGGINSLGPTVAALIVAAICYGKAGVKELLGRYARWRIGWGPLTFALLFPVVITLLAAVNIAAGAARTARRVHFNM